MPTCNNNGKTILEDYISTYEGRVLLYTNTYSVWCKILPSTLSGLAKTWFRSIPPGPVFDFRELTSMFVTHFVNNKRREKTAGELMSIKQGETKSLRDYIGRFNSEAIIIPSLQQEVAVLALMTGLREGTAFRSYLGRKKLTSLLFRGEEVDKVAAAKRPEGDEKEEDKEKFQKDKMPVSFGRK
ncbi:uncharacterized protein LOC104899480 [Beta vulgaris subsp. vulgaris]|uniref:uncharacterized protein LOC104899480 n=1 Tax=Beta vulgaris subsp. vulgaris TaxID=3555 RepID=UPI0020373313|nr:uncharacterized protein LOC104899480 [Beta vulgaris subsp. vulgaris]